MTPAAAAIHTQNGLEEWPFPADSMADIEKHEPDGFYTVGRTFHYDKLFLLEAHFDRLEKSAALGGVAVRLDRNSLRQSMRTMIERANLENARFRITVPRQSPNEVNLFFEPLDIEGIAALQKGVTAASYVIERSNPLIKSNEWGLVRAEARKNLPREVYEVVICDESGKLLEGFSSNFFVVKEGKLQTAGAGVLQGLTRRVVLEVAPDILPLDLTPIDLSTSHEFEEVFITSGSRGLVPVTTFNGVPIGAGGPGAITQALHRAYKQWVEQHLEAI